MNTTLAGLTLTVLAGFQCVAIAQTTSPPAAPPATRQPSYPSTPPPKRSVNPPTQPAEAAKPRCADLTGVEKAECERRDNPDDTAPAGVTPGMKEKEKQKAQEDEAAADTADQ